MSDRAVKGKNYFLEGYNCSQSVALAFADIVNVDKETLLKMASCFGGGMGRLREVCGTFSGILLIEGLTLGYSSPDAKKSKTELYAKIHMLADEFKNKNGSLICRDLLKGVEHTDGAVPEERTPEYYKKRPCPDIVASAVEMLEEHLKGYGVIN